MFLIRACIYAFEQWGEQFKPFWENTQIWGISVKGLLHLGKTHRLSTLINFIHFSFAHPQYE